MFSLPALRLISDRCAWCCWSALSSRSRMSVSAAAFFVDCRSLTQAIRTASSLRQRRIHGQASTRDSHAATLT